MPPSRPPAGPDAFTQAVAWFRARIPMTDADYAKLDRDARQKAFTVAKVADLEMVTNVWTAIDKAVSEGTSFADFQADVGEKLTAAWGAERPWHLETIFRTNVQLAYGAGRWTQLTQPAIMKARPFWKYSAILDGRTSEICAELAGKTYPADDEFWSSHNPPLHHNCRSTVIALTQEQTAGQVDDPADIRNEPQEGFGLPPQEQDFKPDLSEYPAALTEIYKAG